MAAGNLHRDVFDVETGRVFRVAVVQLADGLDANALVLQGMAPAARLAGIGHCIVPKPRIVDVAARREGGARRNANWRWRVSIGESDATRRELVEVGGLDQRMPGAGQRASLVFVRHDDKQVL